MSAFYGHDPSETTTHKGLDLVGKRLHFVVEGGDGIGLNGETSHHSIPFFCVGFLEFIIERDVFKLTISDDAQHSRSVGGGERSTHHLTATIDVDVAWCDSVVEAVAKIIERAEHFGFPVGTPGGIAILREFERAVAFRDFQESIGWRAIGHHGGSILITDAELGIRIAPVKESR